MTDPILRPHDQHIIISAMRYCREVQSYFTAKTTEWITSNWDLLDERTQAQLASDVRVDLQARAQLTLEEKAQLEREQPEWEEYLYFIERKMNE
ncbi:hypothetical protein [Corynebacterium accolens]|uniref:hypothetical protein n=1 Tax=Corynebacterium accolens TaxID=38284 RepID=UPI002543E65D|nr:hypothetical protein [Corynebacterium accolens]MDK4269267.1 hypothetical protein [Corynebacterium accolens]